jgi:hypothetical protein
MSFKIADATSPSDDMSKALSMPAVVKSWLRQLLVE